MPYTIDDFPIETSEAKIDVTLPVGRHVFELVVEDDAGLKSTPDRLVITVQKEFVDEPVIFDIVPSWGVQGTKKIDAVIHGQNLVHVREVKFWRGVSADSQVTATVKHQNIEVAGGELPITIQIDEKTALGERSFTVTTAGGTAQSPPEKMFTVNGLPAVDDVRPDYARVGDETEVHIHGDRLLVASEPLSAHRVEFLYGDEIDSGVTATFVTGDINAEMLVLLVEVDASAKIGEHRVLITTPTGVVESGEPFDVRAQPSD